MLDTLIPPILAYLDVEDLFYHVEKTTKMNLFGQGYVDPLLQTLGLRKRAWSLLHVQKQVAILL